VDALVANCFVLGGRAALRSSGVHVETNGAVGIGMSSIGAEISSAGGAGNSSAAIRIVKGHPSIGGNILFTRGTGERFGVVEVDSMGASDPAKLEGNLFVSVGSTPYGNANGPNPTTQAQLNLPDYSVAFDNDVVADNILETTYSVTVLMVGVDVGDLHLIHPIVLPNPPFFDPNPAVDRGDTWAGRSEYGAVGDDIDGDRRPSFAAGYDLGADEY
jgi:hypothetical protein